MPREHLSATVISPDFTIDDTDSPVEMPHWDDLHRGISSRGCGYDSLLISTRSDVKALPIFVIISDSDLDTYIVVVHFLLSCALAISES